MTLFLKNLLFTVIAPGTVAGWLPWVIAGQRPLADDAALVVAVLLFAAGISIYLWCVWDFATFGRATPAPIDAPKQLVVRGLYRYSRNPMYVGVLTTVLAWSVLFTAPSLLLYAVCVFAAFHSFVLFYEEPHLRAAFGSGYEDYCARVRRWLPLRGGAGAQ